MIRRKPISKWRVSVFVRTFSVWKQPLMHHHPDLQGHAMQLHLLSEDLHSDAFFLYCQYPLSTSLKDYLQSPCTGHIWCCLMYVLTESAVHSQPVKNWTTPGYQVPPGKKAWSYLYPRASRDCLPYSQFRSWNPTAALHPDLLRHKLTPRIWNQAFSYLPIPWTSQHTLTVQVP